MKTYATYCTLILAGLAAICLEAPAAENPRVEEWFAPARFGMFYHWGMFTGGGSSTTGSKQLPHYPTIEAFEKETGAPEAFARNLVGLTRRVGAKYLTITLFHSCDRHMVIYPTKLPYFANKTRNDYLGALIKEAHGNGIRIVCYYGARAHHYDSGAKPYILGLGGKDADSPEALRIITSYQNELFAEMRERYGKDSIDGFWMDGFNSWKPVADSFPNALRIGNNHLAFKGDPPSDVAAAEFTTGPCDPPYNRPSGLRKPNLRWGDDHLVPRSDYVEDIPACNGWWYHGGKANNAYVKDPTYWVKQMLCDVGMRRKWNHTLGLGPRIDGTAPPEFEPMVETMSGFMRWAGKGIYDTVGGECAPLQGGWLNSGAFGVVTVSRKEPKVCYLFVLEPPTKFTKTRLQLQHDGVEPLSVTDLRTGKPVPFEKEGPNGPIVLNVEDWTDVKNLGAKAFEIRLK